MLSPDLSLPDLEIFVNVARLKSLKETSRRLGIRASSLSKVMTKLEKRLGSKLFTRSIYGMELTPEGTRLYRSAAKLMDIMPELSAARSPRRRAQAERSVYSVGSISFVCTNLLAPALGDMPRARRELRMRIVEFNHTELVPYGIRGAFELAVHVEPLEWTTAWHTVELGRLRWGLYARYGHPLGTLCTEAQALRYPFIVPTGWSDQRGYISGEDHCPVETRDRIPGHEASTAETASEIIQCTDDLSFLPEVIARRGAARRQIQEIRVSEWSPVVKQVYLSVRSDKVPKPIFDSLRTELTKQLPK